MRLTIGGSKIYHRGKYVTDSVSYSTLFNAFRDPGPGLFEYLKHANDTKYNMRSDMIEKFINIFAEVWK